jgi:hypothetical protein
MRILLLAPVHWITQWLKQQSDEQAQFGMTRTPLVKGQGQYFWWKALTKLGHEVSVERYTDSTPYTLWGRRLSELEEYVRFPTRRFRYVMSEREKDFRNKRILARVNQCQPDLVIVSGGSGLIRPGTISEIRSKYGSKVVHLNGTSPVVSAHIEEKTAAPHYDWIFTNDHYHSIEWLELGASNSRALPVSACDPEYHQPFVLEPAELEKYLCDVSFVGRLAPEKWYRSRLEALLALSEFNLAIWTDDEEILESHPRLKRAFRGKAYGTDMVKALGASRLALNIHGCFMQRGGNMRTFEIPSTGTLQLIDRYDPSWFTEGEEIVSFRDSADLVKKVRFFLENERERERIAGNGRARVLRDHTYGKRMERLINTVNSSLHVDGTGKSAVGCK